MRASGKGGGRGAGSFLLLDESQLELGSVGLVLDDLHVDLDSLQDPVAHGTARLRDPLVRLVHQPVALLSPLHQVHRAFYPKPVGRTVGQRVIYRWNCHLDERKAEQKSEPIKWDPTWARRQ